MEDVPLDGLSGSTEAQDGKNDAPPKKELEQFSLELPNGDKAAASGEGSLLKPILGVFAICFASVIFGATCAYPSPAMVDLKRDPNAFSINDEQISWVASIVPLWALVGGLVGGPFMDRIGRRLGLLVGAIPFLVGWTVVVAAPNFACMLAGRSITGVCVGIYSVICPIYISEIAPASIRGVLGSCHQLSICLGVLFVYGIGAVVSWRWLGIACGLVLVAMMVAVFFIPESPRWLIASGRVDDTRRALRWLRGAAADVEQELRELEEAVKAAQDKASWREFLQPQLLKPLLISLGLMCFQQLSGINVVLFYTVQIFQASKSELDPNMQTILIGIIGVAGTMVSVFVSDVAGRRILLLVSATVMTVSIGALGAFFHQLVIAEEFATASLAWLPVTSMVIYVFGFNVAFGPIPWIMMSEFFPLRAKSFACGLSTATNWLMAFLLTKFFVNITEVVQDYGGYWICTGFCALAIPFVALWVPETKGKTLEQIQDGFK